jgi:hypothetical protein
MMEKHGWDTLFRFWNGKSQYNTGTAFVSPPVRQQKKKMMRTELMRLMILISCKKVKENSLLSKD